MSLSYQNKLFEFLYPDGWKLDETRSGDGLTVSLQSPFSMFAFINIYDRALEAKNLADQALETMAEEYEDLDADPVSEMISDLPAVGHDVNFFSLDLTNTCWIRAFTSGSYSMLIFAQTNDLDLEQGEAAFRGICASLKLGTSGAA